MKNPELSIILINWNSKRVIFNCLKSLVKTIKKHTFEIIIVDNNSLDGSIEIIKDTYPEIKIIRNKNNNFFAGANNQGYNISSGKYILILNSDIVVTPNCIDGLLDYMKENKSEVITCKLLNKDGSIQYNMHRGFPTFFRLLSSYFYINYKSLGFLPSVKNYLLLNNKFNNDFYVDQAAGAAILISRSLIKKLRYLFDEKNFPLFYNDVDLCYRIRKKGIKILCKTNFKIYHIKGESIKKMNSRDYLLSHLESSKRFFKKHKLQFDYMMLKMISNLLK